MILIKVESTLQVLIIFVLLALYNNMHPIKRSYTRPERSQNNSNGGQFDAIAGKILNPADR